MAILKDIKRDGSFYVGGIGHDIRYVDKLPKNKLYCKDCRTTTVSAKEGCYLFASRKPAFVCSCNKCKKVYVLPAYIFEEEEKKQYGRVVKKSFKFDDSAEARQRILMKYRGFDQEDIDEVCKIMKDDFAKEDKLRAQKERREQAERIAAYKEKEAEKEQKNFKTRLDAGEIKFDKGSRSFYEVATGRIVRKL